MTLNFPDSPSTGDIYTDSTSGFQYEWNGTVWISTDPARAANIKELDDISGSFNGSTTTFNLTVSAAGVGIRTEGGVVGVGVTLLDFRGAGISTFTSSVSGISTLNITGGGGGSGSGIGTGINFDDGVASPFSYVNPEYILEKNITFDTTNAGAGYSSIVMSTIPTITVKSGVGMTVGVGKTLVIDVLQIGDL